MQVAVFLKCSNDLDQISTMMTIEDLLKKTCNDVPIIKLKQLVKDTPPTAWETTIDQLRLEVAQ